MKDKAKSSSPFTGEVAAKRSKGDIRARARQLRKSMTRHEAKLWIQLKAFNKEYGYHFRRQAVAGNYILDFVDSAGASSSRSMAGSTAKRAEPDTIHGRDARFAGSGFRLLRFWNHEIDQSLDGVCDAIPALRATSPVKGEDDPQ